LGTLTAAPGITVGGTPPSVPMFFVSSGFLGAKRGFGLPEELVKRDPENNFGFSLIFSFAFDNSGTV
jgi:hypothetical protein